MKAVITAKFNSKCAETGRPIPKGDPMVYDYSTKKCYARGSNTEIEFVTGGKPVADAPDIDNMIERQHEEWMLNQDNRYY